MSFRPSGWDCRAHVLCGECGLSRGAVGADDLAVVVVDAEEVDGRGNGVEVAGFDLAFVPAHRGDGVCWVAFSGDGFDVPAVVEAVLDSRRGFVWVDVACRVSGGEVEHDQRRPAARFRESRGWQGHARTADDVRRRR